MPISRWMVNKIVAPIHSELFGFSSSVGKKKKIREMDRAGTNYAVWGHLDPERKSGTTSKVLGFETVRITSSSSTVWEESSSVWTSVLRTSRLSFRSCRLCCEICRKSQDLMWAEGKWSNEHGKITHTHSVYVCVGGWILIPKRHTYK